MKKTKAQISYNMSRVRSKGTAIERALENKLRSNRIRFRRHYKIVGTPDFVLQNGKIAIFCDSHFWHGYRWRDRQSQLKSHRSFWSRKIVSNMGRDKQVNKLLRKDGWRVIRLWEHEIIGNPDRCITKIKMALKDWPNGRSGYG